MARISYKIGGSFDDKALKEAQGGIKNFGDNVKKTMGVVAGSLGAIFAVSKVISFAKETSEAFKDGQLQYTKLANAIKGNSSMTEGALQRLTKQADKLQSIGLFDDDTVKKQQAYLAGLGNTEEQIMQIIEAAADMEAGGLGTFESNVENLNKTLSGTAGQFGKIIPEIKDMTAEQLRSGDAIKMMADMYKGFNEEVGKNTFLGVSTKFQNAIGDLKEEVGGIFGALQMKSMETLQPMLEKITVWVEENKEKIINFFFNLPEIAKDTFSLIKNIFSKLFSPEGFKDTFETIATLFITYWKNALSLLFELVKAIGTTIWQPLKTGLEWVGYGILKVWDGIVLALIKALNILIDMLNAPIKLVEEVINAIATLTGGKEVSLQIGKVSTTMPEREKPTEMNTQAIGDAWKSVGTTLNKGIKENIEAFKDANKELGEIYKDEFTEFENKFEKVINKPVENKYLSTGATGATTGIESKEVEKTFIQTMMDSLKNIGDTVKTIFENILGSLGDIGNIIITVMSGEWLLFFSQLIGQLIQSVASLSESFSEFINIITIFIGRLAEIIVPFIDMIVEPLLEGIHKVFESIYMFFVPVFETLAEVLLPLANIANVILQALAPLINMLGVFMQILNVMLPITTVLASVFKILGDALAFFYNKIIVPIVNFLLFFLVAIHNFFIGMYNAVAGVLNSINILGWRPFNISKKKKTNFDDVKAKEIDTTQNSGSSEMTAGAVTSSSASYTAARDIFVNIYYDHSFVNGDAREIAIALRNEIRIAERLGY